MNDQPGSTPPAAGLKPSEIPPSSNTIPVVDSVEFVKTVERLQKVRAVLMVLAGPVMGARIAITGAPLVIGRGAECDVVIPDPGISTRHLEITVAAAASGPMQFHLRDLGSRNGTLVNGERVQEQRIGEGDRVVIGHTPMRLVFQTEAEDEILTNLEMRALQDPLTGLYNRRYLDQRLVEEVGFAVRHGTLLSLLVLDVDHFKAANDGFGHPVGDRVLLEVGAYLRGCVRTEDVVSRMGGDEFAVVLRQIDLDGACVLAERLRRGIEEFPFVVEANRLPVTLSIGVATLSPGRDRPPAESSAALLKAADEELYRAKGAGRNRVCSRRLLPSIPPPQST